MIRQAAIEEMLQRGLDEGVYPGYAAAVGQGDELLFRAIGGWRQLLPTPEPMIEGTLFDMASMSKLIGTTMAALKLIEGGRLSLSSKVSDFFACPPDKREMTVFALMTHTSGIKAHFPLYARGITPDAAVDEILREPLGYAPGSDAVYSCMGYILLAKILEQIEGEPLDAIVRRLVLVPLGLKNSGYCPQNRICAATEREKHGDGIICGVVHDENARFLGGVSGNAGMFCDLDDCIRFARMLARRGVGYLDRALFEAAVTDYTPDFDEHRGLGFQLVGRRYGHTGFTGTSIYVNGDDGRYAILLTNRVHPTRENGKLMPFRREFHRLVLGD